MTQKAEKANKDKGGREEKKETVTQEAEKANKVKGRREEKKNSDLESRKSK